jgi:F5/8 type C domain
MHPVPPAVRRRRPAYLLPLLAAAVALVAGAIVTTVTIPAGAADTLLSQGRPATASSTESGAYPASAAVDGNTGTRWSSQFSDPQWIQVDLGATASVTQVVLQWEAAYATAYQIQVSGNGSTWTTIYSTTTGRGGTETLTVSGSGRYVRMYGTVRATGYGYSLWEFQVYGSIATGGCGTTNAALSRPATASSTESGAYPASAAVDGNTGTRWSSQFSDPQWIQVDLGSSQQVCQVALTWEAAYATAYQIQVSPDAATWTSIYSTTTGKGGTETLTVSGTGRYLRMYGTARATVYGYSLWELVVHTGGGTSPSPSPTGSPLPGGGPLGPNVIVFDPSMSSSAIQSQLDSVFNTQQSNQFGTQRYALLFKPGSYSGINAQIGFYTSIAGLGQNPDDVSIHGDVTVDAGWFNGNATQNFWRSAENLSIYPSAGYTRWAVAQAAPFRRMDIHGDLNLAPTGYGWASGGYIADSRVSGTVQPYSQQQWFTRDSQIGGFLNGVWNMTFSGVLGAPAQSFPNPPYTVIPQSPVTREKPYLYLNGAGAYQVFVPGLRTNSQGTTWAGGQTAGTAIPLTQFYVAHPGDSAATLNQALAQGLNLFFTPGIYHVNQTINVTRANTVVLGIGYPTIVADNGVTAMTVADVDGVKLAGLLFDAGTVTSPVLLQVGPSGATASHAGNPTTVQDVFFRIGGAGAGSATTSLVVNNNNTVIDHIWAWRADHGTGVGWTTNTADTGLIVNGANVSAYALFVEHYQKYEVIWNGNGGRTIFLQNEMPYDPPSQTAWRTGANGYAAYKVADSVTSHEAWGLGSYCYFNVDPTIHADRGFETPVNSNVRFHDLLTVSLGGNGTIDHVINSTGAAATGTSTTPVDVVSYP